MAKQTAKQTARFNMNFTPIEKERYERAAEEQGVTLATYIRQAAFLKYLIEEKGYRIIDDKDQVHNFIFTTVE